MREVRLRDLLIPAPDPTQIEPDVEYQTAGILSHGKGLFARPIRKGSEISYSTYYRLHADQLVYSRLFAWEGALAVVPRQFDGFFVSQEFPTFDIDSAKVLPSYVALLINRAGLWERLAEVVTGMGGRRKRVHPAALFGVAVPVPPLADQRRIVDLLEAVDSLASSASAVAERAHRALVAFARDSASLSGRTCAISDTLSLCLGGDWGGDPGTGELDLPVYRQTEFSDIGALLRPAEATRSFSRRKAERRELRPGDILLQKSAGTPSLPGRVVRVAHGIEESVPSNFLQLLRVDTATCDPGFLFWTLWAEHRSGVALDYQAGTNIRNLDVPAYLARDVVLPPLPTQQRISAAADCFQSEAHRAAELRETVSRLRAAVLNDLLSGRHEIPASYDRFLDGAV